MARRSNRRDVHGIVLLDKPAGMSSNQALQKVRYLFQANKGGHTGTLDPFATGMLPICLGEATKVCSYLLDSGKCYQATAKLGESTDTGDLDGSMVATAAVPNLTESEVREVLQQFVGEISQVPPMYSALKVDGQRLYKLAREGKQVEREARQVTVHEIALESLDSDTLSIRVVCSKGTYIRTLVEDIAKALGTVAYTQSLRRIWVDPFAPQDLVTIAELEAKAGNPVETPEALDCLLSPPQTALPHLPEITVDSAQEPLLRNGNPVSITGAKPSADQMVKIYFPDGTLAAIGELRSDGRLQPKKKFNL